MTVTFYNGQRGGASLNRMITKRKPTFYNGQKRYLTFYNGQKTIPHFLHWSKKDTSLFIMVKKEIPHFL